MVKFPETFTVVMGTQPLSTWRCAPYRVSQTRACALVKNWGNAAHVYRNDNHLTGNAAQSHQGNAAQNYQPNAVQNYQPRATAAREQMMIHPPWGSRFPLLLPEFTLLGISTHSQLHTRSIWSG